jgi:hypothetical protein
MVDAAAETRAEDELFHLREVARSRRTWGRVGSFLVMGIAATAFTLHEIDAARSDTHESAGTLWGVRAATGGFFALGATLAVASFEPYPVERLADVWEADPGRVRSTAVSLRPNVALAPTKGGGELRLEWRF